MSGSDEPRRYRTFLRRFWSGWIDTAVLLPLVFLDGELENGYADRTHFGLSAPFHHDRY